MSLNKLPIHVGFILDGNRRWAKEKNLSPMRGHLAGYKNLHKLALYTLREKKIKFLSVYVFSTENWKRTEDEVGYLMKLVLRALSEYLDDFHSNNIKILVLGSRTNLSEKLLKAIDLAELKTSKNNGGTLCLCFNYGGHQELLDAANKLIKSQDKHKDITFEDLNNAMYHPEVPELDMVVRTSREQRLSGFMLWRSTYAELLFLPKYWPDFTERDIDLAINEYSSRQRRYGA